MTRVRIFQVFLCITSNSIKRQSFDYTYLNDKAILFLTILLSINRSFAHILYIKQFNLTHRSVSIGFQSGLESRGNEWVLHIPQSFNTDGLMLYAGRSVEQSYPYIVIQSMYFTAPAARATGVCVNVCANVFINAHVQAHQHTFDSSNKNDKYGIILWVRNISAFLNMPTFRKKSTYLAMQFFSPCFRMCIFFSSSINKYCQLRSIFQLFSNNTSFLFHRHFYAV